MARALDDASSQYLSYVGAVLSSEPLSISAWFNTNDNTIDQAIFNLGNNTLSTPFLLFLLESADDTVQLVTRDDAGNLQQAISTSTFSTNTWHHGGAVWASSTDTRAFLDGGNKGTDSTPTLGTMTVIDTGIGARISTSVVNEFSGNIAEVGLWNAALTDAEMAILGLGHSPLLVRPASLVAYWPLIGRTSPEIDLVGVYDMTLNAGPTWAAHPRVIYPESNLWTPPSSVQSVIGLTSPLPPYRPLR